MLAFIRTLDPKLVTTLVSLAITRVAVELLGVAESDPLLQSVISFAVAGVTGYLTPNAATILRAPQESGNPTLPSDVAKELQR
jgi:hypothetical protein